MLAAPVAGWRGLLAARHLKNLKKEELVTEVIAYSVTEAAKASNLGRTTIYELIKAGELKPAKIGTRTLILRRDLEGLIERKKAA